MNIAVLASGEGTTLQALIDAGIEISLVISNKVQCGAMLRAAKAGISSIHLRDQDPVEILKLMEIDLVLLLGYNRKVGPKTLKEYRGRIFNTHPSLLPKYGGMYGRAVHEAVAASKDTESGATVHEVDDGYDSGPIVAQVTVKLFPHYTVADIEKEVKAAEKELLIHTIKEVECLETG